MKIEVQTNYGVKRQAELADTDMTPRANWQTRTRGSNWDEYQIYRSCADDGSGGDITRGGAPLPSFKEWMGA